MNRFVFPNVRFLVDTMLAPSGGDKPTPTPGTGGSSNTDLQILLAMLQRQHAEDGHIITSEQFNQLREAILALAQQLSVGPVSQAFTLTLAPNFLPVSGQPAWIPSIGFVDKSAEGRADGWFPLQLPNGARIQSMTVTGRRNGAVPSFHVSLLRQPISSTDTITLITIPLANASDPFQVPPAELQVPGAGPAATEEYRTVDNNNYKYLIEAKVNGADANATAQIQSIQVTYSR